MSNSPDRPRQDQLGGPSPGWLQVLTERRKETSYILFALAAVAGLALAYFAWKDHRGNAPVWLWCGGVAVIALGAGLWQLFREPGQLAEQDMTRLVVLTLGGVLGLITTSVLGLGLTIKWWDTLAGGWSAWTGEHRLRLWWVLLAQVGGLAMMFISLQLARPDQRSSPMLRRLLYGFNAVFSGILLLYILVIINVLTYVKWEEFGNPWKHLAFIKKHHDWTTGSIYSLSEQSEKILQSLDRPVKVYVVMSTQDDMYIRVRALLDNCREVTDKIQVEYLSPGLNRKQIGELQKQFQFNEPGLAVTYGTGERAERHFIKYSDLRESSTMGSRQPAFFNGEAALMSVLNHLAQSKVQPVIYFTQGNGESLINDSQDDEGAGMLKSRLESRGFYQVKGLVLVADDKAKPAPPGIVVSTRVPKEAEVVVVAGPKRPLPEHAIKALREYVAGGPDELGGPQKKGRLMVLLDALVIPGRDTMGKTGLEGLLGEFGVQVGEDIILHNPRAGGRRNPSEILVEPPPPRGRGAESNPVAQAFGRQGFVLMLPRTVRSAPGGPGPYSAEVLLQAPVEQEAWAETDPGRLTVERFERLLQTGEVSKLASPTPLPVAVAVSEDESAMPRDPFHSAARRDAKPRLVVVGDSKWIWNDAPVNSPARNYDLFSSSLAWLRERPTEVGITPKRPDTFEWNPTERHANVDRMILLPGILAAVLIIGLGAGVWIARRR